MVSLTDFWLPSTVPFMKFLLFPRFVTPILVVSLVRESDTQSFRKIQVKDFIKIAQIDKQVVNRSHGHMTAYRFSPFDEPGP